ncbi:MAG: clostripain-related cysteine peptidase [Vulcanimicrobiota bacterium]
MRLNPENLKITSPIQDRRDVRKASAEKKQETGTAEDKVSLGSQQPGNDFTLVDRKSFPSIRVPSEELQSQHQKKWTVLLYSAADNDLEPYQIQDLNEIENVGSSNDLNLVVQLDRGKNPTDISGGWKGARRYVITHNEDPYNIDSPVAEELGQVNMSDPKTLQNFIEWGMKNYPAENYMLLISTHGSGWKGAIKDLSHDGWMKMPEMKNALSEAEKNIGKKIDVVGFDACLMGQTEVAYQLKDHADYMVASQELEGAEGWPYQQILSRNVLQDVRTALMMKVDIGPRDLARFLVRAASMHQDNLPTLSAIDLNRMEKVGKASNNLAKAIIDTDTPNETIKGLVRNSQSFMGFKDHHDFCKKIVESKDITDKKLKQRAKELMETLQDAVILEQHSPEYPGATGLSVELPSYNRSPSEKYKKLDFAKDTLWDEALEKLSKKDEE